jgi:hypothetical protein
MELPFDIEYKGLTAKVQQIGYDENRIFNITFSDNRKPLVITVSVKRDGTKWWTSVPQGRQIEAEEVGKLIAMYIRAKRKEQQ